MKSTTYRMTLSDGLRVQILARNAAEAIEGAVWKYRGRTVAECYSGLKDHDCEMLRKMSHEARPIPGYCTHEIPPHIPIAEDVPIAAPAKRKKASDNTDAMFSPSEMGAK